MFMLCRSENAPSCRSSESYFLFSPRQAPTQSRLPFSTSAGALKAPTEIRVGIGNGWPKGSLAGCGRPTFIDFPLLQRRVVVVVRLSLHLRQHFLDNNNNDCTSSATIFMCVVKGLREEKGLLLIITTSNNSLGMVLRRLWPCSFFVLQSHRTLN